MPGYSMGASVFQRTEPTLSARFLLTGSSSQRFSGYAMYGYDN